MNSNIYTASGYFRAHPYSILIAIFLALVSAQDAWASSGNELQKLFGGIASWYGGTFHGRKTASGGIYDMNKLTCAHKTLPFGTKLLVFNPQNGKKVEVVVTDRGPYVGKRVIDLSRAAAQRLDITGIGNVVCYVGRKILTEAAETIHIKPGNQDRQPAPSESAVVAKLIDPIKPAFVLHGEIEIPEIAAEPAVNIDTMAANMEEPSITTINSKLDAFTQQNDLERISDNNFYQ